MKEKYEELRKKYDLPSFEELDKEFELLYVSPIIEIKFPLKFVRRRIGDKLGYYINLFQGLIQPNPGSPVSLQENKFYTEDELKEIIKLIKEFMIIVRKSMMLELNPDDKKDADFINKLWKDWKDIKKNITKYVSKLEKGWEEEIKK